jgi:hypothetical protein
MQEVFHKEGTTPVVELCPPGVRRVQCQKARCSSAGIGWRHQSAINLRQAAAHHSRRRTSPHSGLALSITRRFTTFWSGERPSWHSDKFTRKGFSSKKASYIKTIAQVVPNFRGGE